MINLIFKIIISVILVFAGIILFTSKIENPLGVKSFVVLTGSMEPTFSAGSIIFTQKQSSYIPNDVIAFKQDNVVVTHRIASFGLKDSRPVFKTKGDANNVIDKRLVESNVILGKQLVTIPYIGNIIFFMRTLPGFIAFIIIPAFIYIAFEIVTIKKEIEKEALKKYLMT